MPLGPTRLASPQMLRRTVAVAQAVTTAGPDVDGGKHDSLRFWLEGKARLNRGYTPRVEDAVMPYAIVDDIAASRDRYTAVAAAVADPASPGSIPYTAGATGEGVRVIAACEDAAAWQHFLSKRLAGAGGQGAGGGHLVLAGPLKWSRFASQWGDGMWKPEGREQR